MAFLRMLRYRKAKIYKIAHFQAMKLCFEHQPPFQTKTREDPLETPNSSCPRVNAEGKKTSSAEPIYYDSLITKLFMRTLLSTLWLPWLRTSVHSKWASHL